MSTAYLAACTVACLWVLVHAIMGGRQVERPLSRDTELEPVVRETMLFCWHLVTGYLALMAVFLGLGALGHASVGLAGTAMAASTAVIGIALAPLRGISYGLLPQGWLFVPIVALGVWAAIG